VDSSTSDTQISQSPTASPPSNRRVLSRITNVVLEMMSFQQVSAWRAGRDRGIDEGYKSGHAEGLKTGRDEGRLEGLQTGKSEGHEEGYVEGHLQGLEEGKLIVELRPGAPANPGAPGIKEIELFKDWTFAITPEMERQIREDVKAYLPDQSPSDDQWKMILSTSPTTSVVAGAGSGKSTTMVLRLIVLYHFLKIDLSSLTVVTFTRESKLDFAKKVREVFDLWGYEVTEKKSLEIVRTFHSRILSFAKSVKGLSDVEAFEFLDDKPDDEDGAMFQVKLGEKQLDIMNTLYQELYEGDPTFRGLIGKLYQRSLLLDAIDQESSEAKERREKVKGMAWFDSEINERLEGLWRAAGHWPISGIEPANKKIRLLGHDFNVNGYIPEYDTYVILGVDKAEPYELKLNDERYLYLRQDVSNKRTLFQAFCSARVVFLNSYVDASQSIDALRGRINGCPKFSYKVRGEISPSLIQEAFYSTASFIENLGLDAVEAVKNMHLYPGDPDQAFFHAMSIYWAAFNERLIGMSPPVMTFTVCSRCSVSEERRISWLCRTAYSAR
jgi:hypothetical protein